MRVTARSVCTAAMVCVCVFTYQYSWNRRWSIQKKEKEKKIILLSIYQWNIIS